MMEEPKWLDTLRIIRIHDEIIRETGGATGLRDRNLLESAVARPVNAFTYGAAKDVFDVAAAYMEGIARNHAFLDGNKRTAFIATDMFLRANGRAIPPEKQNEQLTLVEGVATGAIGADKFAQYLRHTAMACEPDCAASQQQNPPQAAASPIRPHVAKARMRM